MTQIDNNSPMISVVTSIYCSAPYIREFYDRILKTIQTITNRYEIIFVNDGSPDGSLDIVLAIHKEDPAVAVVDLSRNFGHHKALAAGLRQAKGEMIFLIDCDLEEAPELLSDFYRKFKEHEGDADVIYGMQKQREGGWFRRLGGYLFYKIFNSLSAEKIPVNLSMTRLMTRRYVNSFLEFTESEIVLSGLFQLTGYQQYPLTVEKNFKGKTTYNFRRRVVMMINALTDFTSQPLVTVFYLGLSITFFALLFSSWIFYKKIFHNVGIDGWTSVVMSIWFLGGIVIFCLGIVGMYISKIFAEVKKRPQAIIKKIYKPDENK